MHLHTCSTVTAIGNPCLSHSCVMPSLIPIRPVLLDLQLHFLASSVFGITLLTVSSPTGVDRSAESAVTGTFPSDKVCGGCSTTASLVEYVRWQGGRREYGVLAVFSKDLDVFRDFNTCRQSLWDLKWQVKVVKDDMVLSDSLFVHVDRVKFVSSKSAPRFTLSYRAHLLWWQDAGRRVWGGRGEGYSELLQTTRRACKGY